MRVAIVVTKNLTAGQAANCAAILCGQLSAMTGGFFENDPLQDATGSLHAAVKYNVAILKANGTEQLSNTAKIIKEVKELTLIFFSELGQGLSNSFEQYEKSIGESDLLKTVPVAMLVAGPDDLVRNATKKFSLYS